MLSLLVTLIVVAGHGTIASRSSCFRTNQAKLHVAQCDADRNCFIAKYTPEEKAENQHEHEFEAGCINDAWKTKLMDAGFAENNDKCHHIATPSEGEIKTTFSHICTCTTDNCNTEVLNYAY